VAPFSMALMVKDESLYLSRAKLNSWEHVSTSFKTLPCRFSSQHSKCYVTKYRQIPPLLKENIQTLEQQ